MTALRARAWVSQECENLVQQYASTTALGASQEIADRLAGLVERNRAIHERECFNLNPATNVMNPRAEALLASGIGSRPSLGYPGDKYEMGLEAIEEIEVIAAELCAEVFDARFAEIRVASGAMANLYAFMACCKPGDSIIAPPPSIGGHVTHQDAGCAGLYGLNIHPAPIAGTRYSVDLAALRALAEEVRPAMITIGGSLNPFPHPVREIREIADEVGAMVLFDAAHQCGLFAGKAWPNPLSQGAHLMSMSTYKSLGGPAGGLLLTNDPDLAERVDRIAFPGMTANFDASKAAALALTMLDWRDFGADYAAAMVRLSKALAEALSREGIVLFGEDFGFTESHQFAVPAAPFGGGQAVSKKLRQAGFLACGIGLPIAPVENDLNGLRIGTPELVRWGVSSEHADRLASLIARAMTTERPEMMATEVATFRQSFDRLHYIHGGTG